MMRIAYVCADAGVPVYGNKGCTVHVQEVLRAMLRLGAQVELLATRVDVAPPTDFEHVRLHRLPPAPKGALAAREQQCLAMNADINDALHSFGTLDLIYERYSLWSYAAQEYARDHAIPSILEVNAPLIEEQAEHRGLIDRAGAEAVARRTFRAAGVLAPVSSRLVPHLKAYGGDGTRIHVTPNAVNPARFRPLQNERARGRAESFTIGFVGNLKPWHGIPVLLEAFTRLRASQLPFRLLIVGDGPERQCLETEVCKRGLSADVRLVGRVSMEQVPALMAEMDIATAPFVDVPVFYFSPLKLFEYMGSGVPVVASRVGQIEEIIEDGKTGLLCPAGDATALAAAIERLWRDERLRSQLASAGREYVMRHHTWDAAVRHLIEVAQTTQAFACSTSEVA